MASLRIAKEDYNYNAVIFAHFMRSSKCALLRTFSF